MKAVGYVRVSTEEQARYGISLEVQEERIREFCQRRGWELVAVFRDEGVSGAKDPLERPGFRKLIEFCRQNNINICVVYRLDRFARMYPHKLLPLLEELNVKYNILVIPALEFEYIFRDIHSYRLFLQQFAMLADFLSQHEHEKYAPL